MSGDGGRQAERTTTVHNNGSWKRGRDLAPLESQPRARARSVRLHGCASSVCRTSRKAYVNVQRHKGAAFRTVSRGPPMRRVAHSASSRPLVDPSPGCQSTASRIPVTPTAHAESGVGRVLRKYQGRIERWYDRGSSPRWAWIVAWRRLRTRQSRNER